VHQVGGYEDKYIEMHGKQNIKISQKESCLKHGIILTLKSPLNNTF
jgi:hypothetical protein